MKIIKPGVPPESMLYRSTCGACKCEFEFLEGEAKRIGDWPSDILAVLCPTCNRTVCETARIR